MRNKVISFLILFCIILGSFSTYARADDNTIKSKVGCSDENLAKVKAIIAVMRADGYSDAAIAGALGNAWQESGWTPSKEGMWGLNDSKSNWLSSSEHNNCKHLDGNGWCTEGTCTSAYAMRRLGEAAASYGDNLDKYNEFVKTNKSTLDSYKKSNLKSAQAWSDMTYPASLPSCHSLDEFKKITDPAGGACVWMCIFERPAGIMMFCKGGEGIGKINSVRSAGNYTYGDIFFHEFGTDTNKCEGRPAKGAVVYEWITGTAYEPGSETKTSSEGVDLSTADKKTEESLVTNLKRNGYWSEEQVSSFCKLNELDYEKILAEASIDNLSGDDLESLNNWKNTSNDMSKSGSPVNLARIIMMLFGIALCVWAVLFYLGFWFDKVNNFIDISFISILTLGKLSASDFESDCTYGTENKDSNNSVKTINSKIATVIFLVTIIIATSIISGLAYKLMSTLVNVILRLLGQIG